MTRPRFERVPNDYAPRYPQKLDRARYRELIEPDQKARLLRAAATAGALSLGAALPAQGKAASPVESRSEAVLAVMSKATAGPSFWLERTTFARARDKAGHPVVIPSIPISYGNSHNGVFDAERARDLVQELFVAYGLKPVRNHRLLGDGVEAELDVYEPALQIGTELRGKMPKEGGMFATAEAEADADNLADQEQQQLTQKGHHIHCADLDDYPLMDGDQATPTFAYLASIVAFLNEVTGGPDIDLDAILDNARVRTPLRAPAKWPDAVELKSDKDGYQLLAKRTARVTFEFAGKTDYEQRTLPTERRGQPVWVQLERQPTAGPIRMLQLTTYPATAMRIEQDGKRPVHIDAAGCCAFLPARFDPRRPFRITLLLEGGKSYRVPSHLELVGTVR